MPNKIELTVTMYCYIHVLCIYFHNMYHCVADGDMHVSGMCICQQALTADKARYKIYTYTAVHIGKHAILTPCYTEYTVSEHCAMYHYCNIKLYYMK